MMEEKKQKKNKVIKGIALLGLFLMVFGISYALFQVTLNGKKTNIIKSAKFDLKLTDKNGVEEKDLPDGVMGINLENAVPMSTKEALETIEPYEFNIVNEGNVPIRYTLYLDETNSTTLPDDKIRYHLQRTDTNQILSLRWNGTLVNTIDEDNNVESMQSSLLSLIDKETGEDNNNLYKLDLGVIGPGQTQKYALRLWVSYDANTEINDLEFGSKLKIKGEQASKDDAYVVRQYNVTGEQSVFGFNVYLGKFSDKSIRFFGVGNVLKSEILDYFLYETFFSSNIELINNILNKYGIDSVNDYDDFMDKIGNQCMEIEDCGNEFESNDEIFSVGDDFNGKVYFEDGILDIDPIHSPDSLFGDLDCIEKAYISTTISSMHSYLFKGSSKLTDVKFIKNKNPLLTDSELTLSSSFSDCENLENLYLEDNVVYISSGGAFANDNKLNLIINAKSTDVRLENANVFNDIQSVTWLKD